MTASRSKALLVSGLLSASVLLSPLVALAQTPYWDNSQGSSYSQPPATNYGYGAQQQQYSQQQTYSQQPQQLRGYLATAPAGTSLNGTTTTYLSSANSRVGDPIAVTLGYDLSMGGNLVLPSGSIVQGQVVSAIPAGRIGKQGQLQLRFNSAQLPDGRTVPLSARLVTSDGTGVIKGGTTKGRVGGFAKNAAGGAALGAVSGTALGAIVGGGNKWNEGLLWGSILGAGAGLAKGGVNRGEEAELQPGTQLQLMLDQPLTVSPSSSTTQYPY